MARLKSDLKKSISHKIQRLLKQLYIKDKFILFFSVQKYEMWVARDASVASVKRSADCHSLCNQY